MLQGVCVGGLASTRLELDDVLHSTATSMGLPGSTIERRARLEQETRRNMPRRPVRSRPTRLGDNMTDAPQ